MKSPLLSILIALLALSGSFVTAQEEEDPGGMKALGESMEKSGAEIAKAAEELHNLVDVKKMHAELSDLIDFSAEDDKNIAAALGTFHDHWVGDGKSVTLRVKEKGETWFEKLLDRATETLDTARAEKVTDWFAARKMKAEQITGKIAKIGAGFGRHGALIGAEAARIAGDMKMLFAGDVNKLSHSLALTIEGLRENRTEIEKVCRELDLKLRDKCNKGDFNKALKHLDKLSCITQSDKWMDQARAIHEVAAKSLDIARLGVLETDLNREAIEEYAGELSKAAEELRGKIDLKYGSGARTSISYQNAYREAIRAYKEALGLSLTKMKASEKAHETDKARSEGFERIKKLNKAERSIRARDNEILRLKEEIEALKREVRRIRKEQTRSGGGGGGKSTRRGLVHEDGWI
jgi:hypothetical protein